VNRDLPEAESGCLLLADITGYTAYLKGTELEHAQDVLADLLETIVDALEPTFVLSKLEGDAAFAYASAGSINPSMLLDTVEAGYFSFRRRLRDVTHATTCDCNACVLIPSLDLKFFVHSGHYVVREIARTEELTGSDVVLIHRLLKGTASEVIKESAYAVYTRATLDAMGVDPVILGFTPHVEHFDDVGEVEVFIEDLTVRWKFEQERHRVFVTPSQAILDEVFELSAPPEVVWHYLTDPAKRAQWQSSVTDIVTVTEGRRGVGSINHCMHGPEKIIEHVADWRPFSYLTVQYDLDDGTPWPWTFEFEPVETGTRLHLRMADLGPDVMGFFADYEKGWRAEVETDRPILERLLREEVGTLEASSL
jgi:hypothetical protein